MKKTTQKKGRKNQEKDRQTAVVEQCNGEIPS